MSGARILAVDDEPAVLLALTRLLEGAGYRVWTAEGAEQGLRLAAEVHPDVVLLDLMLPGLSGEQALARLREASSVPVIVLSARGEDAAKVRLLDAGADDYLTKPFSADELLARVRVALRRAVGVSAGAPVLEVGDLRLDAAARDVSVRGAPVHLTPKEFDILRFLMQHAGRVATHRQLLQAVWGPEYADESEYLRFFVRQLRQKIEDDPHRPRRLVTEPGVGYRFVAP